MKTHERSKRSRLTSPPGRSSRTSPSHRPISEIQSLTLPLFILVLLAISTHTLHLSPFRFLPHALRWFLSPSPVTIFSALGYLMQWIMSFFLMAMA